MQGEKVIARGFRSEPFIVRVCGTNRDIVYITGDENYEKLKKGEKAASPVAVPIHNVFRFDAVLYDEVLKNWKHNPNIWKRLQQWKDMPDESGREARAT